VKKPIISAIVLLFAIGIFAQGLPFWATEARLPDNTWYEIPESNKLNDISQAGGARADGTVIPGAYYSDWRGSPVQVITQWSGGDFSPDYSTYGGYVVTGNGHWLNAITLLNNCVCVWDCDDATWKFGVNGYYDPTATGNLAPSANASPGNPSGTFKWALYTPWFTSGDPSQCQQADSDLAIHGEYAYGIPAASHTYGNCCVIPPSCGGSAKGSLLTVMKYAYGSNARGDFYSHEADLAAGRWKRHMVGTPAITSVSVGCRGSWALDTRRKKIVIISIAPTAQNPYYGPSILDVDPASPTYKQSLRCPIPWPQMNNDHMGGEANSAFLAHPVDSNLDVVVSFNGYLSVAWEKDILANAGRAAWDNNALFWNAAQTAPCCSTAGTSGGFCVVPELGSIFVLDRGPGLTAPALAIWKLTPPATPNNLASELRNGTWTWTRYPLTRTDGSGNALATQNPNDWCANGTYNRFMYSPKAKAFLLCDGEGMKMRAFRPEGLLTGTRKESPASMARKVFEISTSPNPFNSSVLVRVPGFAGTASAQLAIYDMQGKRVYGQSGKTIGQGIVWNASKMPCGTYVVKFTAGQNQTQKRIALIR
jgi:hypothetical protein